MTEETAGTPKPTISELEAIMADTSHRPISINPDGSIVAGKSYAELQAEVAALTTHLEAEIDSHIASRKGLRERAETVEAQLDAANEVIKSNSVRLNALEVDRDAAKRALAVERGKTILECSDLCRKLAEDIDMERVPDIRGETAANRLAESIAALAAKSTEQK